MFGAKPEDKYTNKEKCGFNLYWCMHNTGDLKKCKADYQKCVSYIKVSFDNDIEIYPCVTNYANCVVDDAKFDEKKMEEHKCQYCPLPGQRRNTCLGKMVDCVQNGEPISNCLEKFDTCVDDSSVKIEDVSDCKQSMGYCIRQLKNEYDNAERHVDDENIRKKCLIKCVYHDWNSELFKRGIDVCENNVGKCFEEGGTIEDCVFENKICLKYPNTSLDPLKQCHLDYGNCMMANKAKGLEKARKKCVTKRCDYVPPGEKADTSRTTAVPASKEATDIVDSATKTVGEEASGLMGMVSALTTEQWMYVVLFILFILLIKKLKKKKEE